MSDAPLHLIALALFAEINARIDAGESRQLVLDEKGLSEAEYGREQQRWLQLLASQAEQQQWQLQQRYSAVYSQWRLKNNAHAPPPLPSRVDTMPGFATPFTPQPPLGASSVVTPTAPPGFPGTEPYTAPKYDPPKYDPPKYDPPKYDPPTPPLPAHPADVSPSQGIPVALASAPFPGAGGYAPAKQAPAPLPSANARPFLAATQELAAFPGASSIVPSETEPAAFPMPAQPTFTSPRAETSAFAMPAQPVVPPAQAQPFFVSPKTEPVVPPVQGQPFFVSPQTEPIAAPEPARVSRASTDAGPPYFSSSFVQQPAVAHNPSYPVSPSPQPVATPAPTRAESFAPARRDAAAPLPPPPDDPKPPSPQSPAAASPAQAFAASGYFVTHATGAWQAQQPAPIAAQHGAAPAALPLSFEQLTCLTAEIESNPARSATALAGYGIDDHSYQTQLQALRVRCEADPELQQRYDRLIQYYRAVVGQR